MSRFFINLRSGDQWSPKKDDKFEQKDYIYINSSNLDGRDICFFKYARRNI